MLLRSVDIHNQIPDILVLPALFPHRLLQFVQEPTDDGFIGIALEA